MDAPSFNPQSVAAMPPEQGLSQPFPFLKLPKELAAHVLQMLKKETPYLKKQDHHILAVNRNFKKIYKHVCKQKLNAIARRHTLIPATFRNDFSRMQQFLEQQVEKKHPIIQQFLERLDLSSVSCSPEQFIDFCEKGRLSSLNLKHLNLTIEPGKTSTTTHEDGKETNDPRLQKVIKALATLKNLQSLNLNMHLIQNDVETLVLHLSKLREIDLDVQVSECFTSIAIVLSRLEHLTKLSLRNLNTYIEDEEQMMVKAVSEPAFASFLNRLESLYVSGETYTGEKNFVIEGILPAAPHLTHLKSLSIIDTDQEEQSNTFYEFLKRIPNPEKLISYQFKIDYFLLYSHIEQIIRFQQLQQLSIKENAYCFFKRRTPESGDLTDDTNFPQLIEHAVDLQDLSLKIFSISGRGISLALQNCLQLKRLVIEECTSLSKLELIDILSNKPLEYVKICKKAYCFNQDEVEGAPPKTIKFLLEKTFKDQQELDAFIELLRSEETPDLLFGP
ncbi:MAG: hypothetical protein K0S07_535 [Chlamydiales bacterium]|jgi:hypothetical protein|nr:hypothetical protein [Chlamydiales bacterium]